MQDNEKTTSPSTVRALLEEALTAIVRALDGAPSTPETRELLRKADSFRRIVAAWEAFGPKGLRLETVGESVSQLHEETLAVVAAARRDPSATPDDGLAKGPSKKRGL